MSIYSLSFSHGIFIPFLVASFITFVRLSNSLEDKPDIVALNVGDVKNKSHIRIVEKKTGKFKKFPINSKLKPMLEEFTKGKHSEEPLFTTIFGNRMDRFGAYYILKTACKSIKLQEKIGTHTMRKTFEYHHYQKFKDVTILQKILIILAHK